MTPIEYIREQIRGIRVRHTALFQKRHPMLPGGGTIESICASCGDANYWPCQTLKLAEDKLKLAEAANGLLNAASGDDSHEWMEAVEALERTMIECAPKEQ